MASDMFDEARNGEQNLAVYPIRTVAKLTGVSEGALRAWEVRYGVIAPARTAGGHRLFSRHDIDTILEIQHMLHVEGLSMAGVQSVLARAAGGEHG
jgi:MerR family transcriptional regulator, light-induced transcriptional regulator